MANNITMQNNIVTAGKFVTIGTGVDTSRQSLRAIASAIAIEDQSATQREVESIVNGGISASEKVSLRTLYEELTSRYLVLSNSVSQIGYTGDDWDLVRNRFSLLEDEMNKILFDMQSDYDEPTDIDTIVKSYLSLSTSFSLSLENFINSSDGYTISLQGPSSPIQESEDLVVNLSITDPSGIQYALSKTEVSTIEWHFTGTGNDAKNTISGVNPLVLTSAEWHSFFTGRSIEISASLTIFPN